jgi:hypothetical protein
MATATLTNGWDLLDANRDSVVAIMREQFHVPPDEAEAGIAQLHDRWVGRMVTDKGCTLEFAEEAIGAAIAYLASRGDPTARRSPGELADLGLHLILSHDTRVFASLSYALTGKRWEHRPNDVEGFDNGSDPCDCC